MFPPSLTPNNLANKPSRRCDHHVAGRVPMVPISLSEAYGCVDIYLYAPNEGSCCDAATNAARTHKAGGEHSESPT